MKGSERAFTGSHAFTLADTTVRGHLSLNIECWEADHSSGGFYNKMREVLATMAERLAEGAQSQTYSPPERGGDNGEGWAALLAIILGLVNLLLGWLTNDDDLVCERSINLSRSALDRYFTAAGREEWWDFNGGSGAVTGSGCTPVRYRSLPQAGSWTGEALTGDQRNIAAPPVGISYNGNLGILYVDAATKALLWIPHGNNAGTGYPARHRPPSPPGAASPR
ncbi:hypothetical protein [Streptomyces antibioticus]|uniref:hypothetical protein n=1 Tax=Streptomyces antibioticus TaxID=1890 RepID=UPI0033D6C3F9